MAGQGDEWPIGHRFQRPTRRLCRHTHMPVTARRISILPYKDEPVNAPFMAPNAGGAIRDWCRVRHAKTRSKDHRNRHPPRYFGPDAPPKPKLAAPARRLSCCQRDPPHHHSHPLPSHANCSKREAFHGCNSEPLTARECGQKRHGMEARRAETAKRVRFTTARRAGLVPARALNLMRYRDSLATCASIGYTTFMVKDSGLRIRVQRDLRDKFLEACRTQDKPAAQVIREFMREYVERQERTQGSPATGQEGSKAGPIHDH